MPLFAAGETGKKGKTLSWFGKGALAMAAGVFFPRSRPPP